jgi:hypothetical protein
LYRWVGRHLHGNWAAPPIQGARLFPGTEFKKIPGKDRGFDKSLAGIALEKGDPLMKKTLISVFTAGAIIGALGAASAQQIYLDFGPNPGYAPPPPGYGYGPPPPAYGYPPPPGYGPGYGPPSGYGPPGPYYRSYEGGRGYYRPGRFRTWNGCQPGWTVQDGLCKPYRGY